jgi:acyl-CoA synthetase (AMP-forming)/AMP-acid ligase II
MSVLAKTRSGNSPQQVARLSVRDLIDRRAAEQADDVFLIAPDSGQTLIYSGLRNAVRRVASLIAQYGVEPGDSVAYAMSNGHDALIAILGTVYGGYRATAINLIAGSQTIAHVLDHSQSRLVLAGREHLPLIEGAFGETAKAPPVVTIVGGQWPRTDSGQASIEASIAPPPLPESDGLLMYTSGTTGRPKGAVLSHANLIAGGANTALAHELTAADRALCVLPLYHINGLCVTVMGSLVAGGSLVLPAKFSVARFWDLIAAHRCSWFSVVPTQISYLLHDAGAAEKAKSASQCLRFGRSASAPLAPDVQEAFEAAFGVPIIETMGLTETAAPILSNPLPPGERRTGSPGIAFGNEVIIADNAHNEVPRGAQGEVLVRGPNVMKGYLRNPEATAEALTADGWLRTGDLGRMDEAGYVFITGRLKELIIKGGENIAPREVDEALYAHPDVIEAAAFACDCKDYGQRIEAAVSVAPSANVTESELITLCVERIGSFKAPDRVYFLPELPKGPSGKIQRLKLVEMAAAG